MRERERAGLLSVIYMVLACDLLALYAMSEGNLYSPHNVTKVTPSKVGPRWLQNQADRGRGGYLVSPGVSIYIYIYVIYIYM